jgi:hypothetical protein
VGAVLLAKSGGFPGIELLILAIIVLGPGIVNALRWGAEAKRRAEENARRAAEATRSPAPAAPPPPPPPAWPFLEAPPAAAPKKKKRPKPRPAPAPVPTASRAHTAARAPAAPAAPPAADGGPPARGALFAPEVAARLSEVEKSLVAMELLGPPLALRPRRGVAARPLSGLPGKSPLR